MEDIKIIQYEFKNLKPYTRNNKKHPAEQVQTIVKSIKEFGFRNPILIEKDGTIISGHGRYLAARELNMDYVPAIIVSGLTPEQLKAFRIMDNKSAESEYDYEAIRYEFQELIDKFYDLDKTGFNTKEVNQIMNIAILDPNDLKEVSPDDLNKIKTDIKKGDMFQLGNHKLICGDSTDRETYEKLMGAKKANLMVTDPPYNVDYEAKFLFLAGKRGNAKRESSQIQNDFMSQDKFYEFLKAFYSASNWSLLPGSSIYVFHSESEGLNFRAAMKDAGFKFSQTLIWVKQSFVIGRADYHYQHEPILYGWKEGKAHFFINDRSQGTTIEELKKEDPKKLSKTELIQLCQRLQEQARTEPTTVIRCDRPTISEDHPTQKPVKLIGKLILNSSKQDDIVLEPFGGSGTAIIACEQLKRNCYCIELDEKYCQVIINRWQKLTGKTAIKMN